MTEPAALQREKILITVKTYPLPSTTASRETVCTAGVREDGSFIRLYPVDYRYRPYTQWYSKYSWVAVNVRKGKKGDYRPESFEPVGEFELLGSIDPRKGGNWAERKKYVLAQGTQTMCHLQSLRMDQRSLGIVRPRVVENFLIEEAERKWKPEWENLYMQDLLFGPKQKPLEKIPFKFSYRYKCEEEGCRGHTMMIEDWEVGQLFRKMRDKFGDERIATEKVKERFFDQICGPTKDTHFFVGTVFGYPTWIVLGTFWPEK